MTLEEKIESLIDSGEAVDEEDALAQLAGMGEDD